MSNEKYVPPAYRSALVAALGGPRQPVGMNGGNMAGGQNYINPSQGGFQQFAQQRPAVAGLAASAVQNPGQFSDNHPQAAQMLRAGYQANQQPQGMVGGNMTPGGYENMVGGPMQRKPRMSGY